VGCYRNILVAVDGSADAAAALRHATSLARDQHAKLILLTVVPAPPPQVVSPGGLLPPPGESDEAYAAILRDAVDTLPPDVGVLHHALIGSVSDSVLLASRVPVLLMRAAGPQPELATGERRDGPDPTTTPAADSSVVSGPLR
jgi:nucleotide-binding universal stress UspA family protein